MSGIGQRSRNKQKSQQQPALMEREAIRREMVGEQVVRGVVKWFNDSHGYGFITPAEGGRDVFVHWTCLDKNGQRWTTLTPGQNVEFLIVDTPKGPKAVQVRPATEVNGNQ